MDMEEWLKYGYDQGFISAPICATHDGIPMSLAEDVEFDAGYDPCVHAVRLYDDLDHKKEIEDNHAPSQWRASNRGWKDA